MIHELKTWQQYFKAVANGTKTFELRKNDRNFKVGDTLILEEWEPGLINTDGVTAKKQGYTGRKIEKKITYLLESGEFGLRKGYAILGFK